MVSKARVPGRRVVEAHADQHRHKGDNSRLCFKHPLVARSRSASTAFSAKDDDVFYLFLQKQKSAQRYVPHSVFITARAKGQFF